MLSWQYWIIFLSIISSAFFSGMEIAFVSANKLQLEVDVKQGKTTAKWLKKFMRKPSRFITTTLVGNNLSLVIYGIYMAKLLEPRFSQWIQDKWELMIFQTVISTLIILIFAEFLPKAIFRINPNRILYSFVIPIYLVYYLLYPFVWLISNLTEVFLNRFFGVEFSAEKTVFKTADLNYYLKEISENKESEMIDNEIQIAQNALDFTKIKVRECMIPRNEIIALNIDDDIDTLKEKFIETGLSKILIYRENIDNIIGYVHVFELVKKPTAIKNILLPVAIVPETMPANKVLDKLMKERRSIAVVVDEFGGTAGIVTMEDIIEEIFGEIEDEHDKEALIEEKIDEYTYLFSARLEIDELNERYHLNLPKSEEYETLAGLILSHTGSIPKEKEKIYIDRFLFTIEKVKKNKIHLVRLEIFKEN
jgi:CBS domain containing-hemolysin-like protein